MFVGIFCIVWKNCCLQRWKSCRRVVQGKRLHYDVVISQRETIESCATIVEQVKHELGQCKSSGELVTKLSKIFSQRGVPEPKLSAEYLVASCYGLTRAQLLHNPFSLSRREPPWNTITQYALRRLHREPVQYIVGNWDFYNLLLKVRPPVLIPRPETEELVDKIVQSWKDSLEQRSTDGITRCLEVGCGSGAISLSLLKAWKEVRGNRNSLKVTAIDIDPEAVALTRENACLNLDSDQKQSLDIRLQDVATFSLNECRYDFLVSNPPYVPEAAYRNLQLEIVEYESPCALLGGEDGNFIGKYAILILLKSCR